jgi:hypothetical protein
MCERAILAGYYSVSHEGSKAKVCVDDAEQQGCYESFRVCSAPKCAVCKQPVLGSFYPVDEGRVCTNGTCMDKYLQP